MTGCNHSKSNRTWLVNNIVKEMTQTTEELVTELTKSKQVKSLIKSTTEALENLTAAILANSRLLAMPLLEMETARLVLTAVASTQIAITISAWSCRPMQPRVHGAFSNVRVAANRK